MFLINLDLWCNLIIVSKVTLVGGSRIRCGLVKPPKLDTLYRKARGCAALAYSFKIVFEMHKLGIEMIFCRVGNCRCNETGILSPTEVEATKGAEPVKAGA